MFQGNGNVAAADGSVGICGVLGMRMRGLTSCEVETKNGVSWKRVEASGVVAANGRVCSGWHYVVLVVHGVGCGRA